MGMLDDVIGLFPHVVTIEPFTGETRTGVSTYGPGQQYRAKIERGSRQIRGSGNETIIPQYKIFIGAPLFVDVRDRVTSSYFKERNATGSVELQSPIIRQVLPVYDETEQVCTIIYCG